MFLPGSKLNFANNLLPKNDKKKAATFISENGFREERSWQKLNQNSNKLVQFLKDKKINQKDRVAAYMPNTIETVGAFISTVDIGAIWSSCSPDFGVKGVIERFSQINPKILFITDQYYYNGKQINIIDRLPEILEAIPSIKNVVVTNYPGKKFLKIKKKIRKIQLVDWMELMKTNCKNLIYPNFDFEHELAILCLLYTSPSPRD